MSKKNLKHAFVGQDSEDTQVKIEKACSLATSNYSRRSLVLLVGQLVFKGSETRYFIKKSYFYKSLMTLEGRF